MLRHPQREREREREREKERKSKRERQRQRQKEGKTWLMLKYDIVKTHIIQIHSDKILPRKIN